MPTPFSPSGHFAPFCVCPRHSHFFQKYGQTHPTCPSSPTVAVGEPPLYFCRGADESQNTGNFGQALPKGPKWVKEGPGPWSHQTLDFLTGLPVMLEKTVVLTLIDRFGKFAWFLPLPNCQLELFVKEMFCTYGLLSEIVSDHSPQLSSAVLKAFCTFIGATISLTSG